MKKSISRIPHRLYRLIIVGCLVALIGGCSAAGIEQYVDNQPKLDLFEYFKGKTTGWGVVFDRSGSVTRQFVVYIQGTSSDNESLILDEKFHWSDGEKSERVWTIHRDGSNGFRGQAADVVGEARGTSRGNALKWQYNLQIEVDGRTWTISFDDWMYLQPDNILLNRATMRKFGLRVGEVYIAFQKDQNM